MGLRIDRLREIRESRGLSQRDLARMCGFGKLQIHRYEAGKAAPSATHLGIIAEQLEVSADYLLGLSNEPRGKAGDTPLNSDQRDVIEAFERSGWIGIVRLGTERIAAILEARENREGD